MSGYGSSSSITVVPTGAVAMAATLNKAEGSRPGNRGLNKALEDAVRDMLFRGGTPPAADRPFPLPEADEGDFSHFDLKLKASRKIKGHSLKGPLRGPYARLPVRLVIVRCSSLV